MVYSYDIFDTLITREVATPKGVFCLMQEALINEDCYAEISSDIKRDFMDLRIHAEEIARYCVQKNGIEDIVFDDIYKYMSMRGGLSKENCEILKQLEIEVEYDVSVGIKDNIEEVKRHIAEGNKVILISDMYLPKNIIREMLVKADDIFQNIPLYVSSEYGKIKFSGNLYRLIASKENINFNEWIHRGDNPRGDVKGAEKVGIRANHFKFPGLTDLESELIKKYENDSRWQKLIGTSRNARLTNSKSIPFAIGTSIGAPILTAYVEWILDICKKENIRHLYFIARDGYITKKIADIIIFKKRLEITTSYIYGSRKAWRMPSFSKNNDNIRELLAWSHINRINSIEKLADVFQISSNDILRFLSSDISTVGEFSSSIRNYVIDIIDTREFKDFLIEKNRDFRKIAVEYLKANINTRCGKFAFVELAGSGYTQVCLSKLMQDFYCEPIHSFYFKVDQLLEDENCKFYVYFPSRLKQNILIEALCHAPHGQTIGYDKDTLNPILESYEDDALINHGINDYIEGICKFVKIKYGIDKYDWEISLDNVKKTLEYVIETENEDVMNFIGDMPNSVTGREKEVIGYAPKLTDEDIRNIFKRKKGELVESYYKGTSLEYSLKRCSKEQKILIEECKVEKELADKVSDSTSIQELECVDFLKRLSGKKIAIYAAGTRGQQYYQRLKDDNYFEIVAWVDRDWKCKQASGLPVCSVDALSNSEFDRVLICIDNTLVALDVKNELIKNGIDIDKIVCI